MLQYNEMFMLDSSRRYVSSPVFKTYYLTRLLYYIIIVVLTSNLSAAECITSISLSYNFWLHWALLLFLIFSLVYYNFLPITPSQPTWLMIKILFFCIKYIRIIYIYLNVVDVNGNYVFNMLLMTILVHIYCF